MARMNQLSLAHHLVAQDEEYMELLMVQLQLVGEMMQTRALLAFSPINRDEFIQNWFNLENRRVQNSEIIQGCHDLYHQQFPGQ